ncbi:hypothetical protein ACTJIL_12225 [Luteimonas sp. 22616]|jgi:hypothetical protein|uniref:hypothetical protein n=1 Tax=Luteimonas sp. 22616 TaxID=3453951 RepID=UPI003F86D916
MTAPVNIICMKWGVMYGPEYVNRLHAGVRRHLQRPHRFVCFTDTGEGLDPGIEVMPLPPLGLPEGHNDRRWQKLAVFGHTLGDLQGSTLFLDLDLVVVDSLEPFFDRPGKFLIIRDADLFKPKWRRKLVNPERDRFLRVIGNSSVFRFEIGQQAYILDNFVADPDAATRQYPMSQQYQSAQLAAHGELEYWPRGWCVSFKNDCVPRFPRNWFADPTLPDGAKIVVFAGRLKMSEVIAGGGQRLHRHIGDVDWLRKAWMAP